MKIKEYKIKNQNIIIDSEDSNLYESYKWYLVKSRMKSDKFYAITFINGKINYLHRLIMNAKKGQIVDHINSNTLDCTKINMRFVTYSQNRLNANKSIKKEVKYKGVFYRHGRTKPYMAKFNRIIIGNYLTQEEARDAYQKVLIKFVK